MCGWWWCYRISLKLEEPNAFLLKVVHCRKQYDQNAQSVVNAPLTHPFSFEMLMEMLVLVLMMMRMDG